MIKAAIRITATRCNFDVTKDNPSCLFRYFGSEKKNKNITDFSQLLHHSPVRLIMFTTHPAPHFVTGMVEFLDVQCNAGVKNEI